MGQGAHYLQSLPERHEGHPAQRSTDHLDQGLREVGEIADGLVLDLLPLAVASPQQMGRVHTAFVAAPCGDDMNSATSLRHAAEYSRSKSKMQLFSDYI